MGLDSQLLDGAAPDKRVSRTAAGIFGFLMALAVLCVEEFRMAQNSPSVSAGATFHLPLGLVPTSLAKSAGSDCQLFLASHYINDPKIFKAFMDGMTPEMLPKGVSSHAFLPTVAPTATRRSACGRRHRTVTTRRFAPSWTASQASPRASPLWTTRGAYSSAPSEAVGC